MDERDRLHVEAKAHQRGREGIEQERDDLHDPAAQRGRRSDQMGKGDDRQPGDDPHGRARRPVARAEEPKKREQADRRQPGPIVEGAMQDLRWFDQEVPDDRLFVAVREEDVPGDAVVVGRIVVGASGRRRSDDDVGDADARSRLPVRRGSRGRGAFRAAKPPRLTPDRRGPPEWPNRARQAGGRFGRSPRAGRGGRRAVRRAASGAPGRRRARGAPSRVAALEQRRHHEATERQKLEREDQRWGRAGQLAGRNRPRGADQAEECDRRAANAHSVASLPEEWKWWSRRPVTIASELQ